METIIQFVQTEKNNATENLVKDKLENLSERYDWLIRADVFFKEEKGTYGKGKICDIRLSCPGPRIFASSNEDSFENAVAETIRDLEVQLKKRKSEMRSHK
ncbi:MAG: HPF/RaiA family ribosome-associated protein [Ignavibacteria bacterium]|nr:HPF/RaiA family ribosome-associated protein [Ignavibacteria bacterium]